MYACRFCTEFEGGKVILSDEKTVKAHVLYETQNFIVFPPLGPVMEGHVLISPKEHTLSVATLPAALLAEFENVQNKAKIVMKDIYGHPPIFFEHGPAAFSSAGGCCVDHAHLHAVPAMVDLLQDLQEKFTVHAIGSYKALQDWQVATKRPYLLYENKQGERYIVDIPDIIQSQYLRRLLANKMGCPDRQDWRANYNLEEMATTAKKWKARA